MKKILIFVLLFSMLSLSGCAMFKELRAGMDDATTLIEEFCTALADDDLTAAQSKMHPESTPPKSELSAYVSKLEQNNNVDFSNGVAFKRRSSTSATYYDSQYDGSVYENTYEIVVGNKAVDVFFVVVKNDKGYGIYSFGIVE